MRVAFIGLGDGAQILLKVGHDVRGFDARAEAGPALCKASGMVAVNVACERQFLLKPDPMPVGHSTSCMTQMAHGRRFRVLNITDDVTHECLGAIPDTSISGHRVARELTAIIARRGKPGMIVSDNGTELTSHAILAWTKDHAIDWHYTRERRSMARNPHLQRFAGARSLGHVDWQSCSDFLG